MIVWALAIGISMLVISCGLLPLFFLKQLMYKHNSHASRPQQLPCCMLLCFIIPTSILLIVAGAIDDLIFAQYSCIGFLLPVLVLLLVVSKFCLGHYNEEKKEVDKNKIKECLEPSAASEIPLPLPPFDSSLSLSKLPVTSGESVSVAILEDANWTAHVDDEGTTFYLDASTGATAWTKPE